MNPLETLKQFNLTENEAKVYLALLELGSASVQAASRKSGVKRTTIYTLIDSLKQKGLVSETQKGAKTYFNATDPESLLLLSGQRLHELKRVLPELKSIYNAAANKPKVKFYEGQEGYLTVYENILKDSPKELLVISSYDDFCKHIDEKYEADWTQRRIDKKIYLRWLDFKTPLTEKMHAGDRESYREIRFLPDEFKFQSIMFLYGQKVILVSGQQTEFNAVVIENTEFAKMWQQIFEMLWQEKEPKNKG